MNATGFGFFVYGYPPDFSGATNQAIKVAKVLKNEHYDPIFFSYTFNKDYLGAPCKEGFSLVRFLRPKKESLLLYNLRLLKEFFKKRNSFKVLYINGNDGQFWTPAYLIFFSVLFKKKCFMEINMEYNDPLSIRDTALSSVKKRIAAKAGGYIVLSTAIENKMKSLYPGFPIVKIYNGVDLSRFNPVENLQEKKNMRLKLGLPEDAQVVVTCGGVSKRKGIDFLLSAWRQIISKEKNCVFVVLGPLDKYEGYSEAFTDSIMTQSKDKQFEGNVFFRGTVSNVNDYFKAADVFAFAGRQEGSPNVLREAMASGLPVVSLELRDITSDMIEDGKNGFIVKVKDQERLNDWVNRDISDPELIDEFSQKILHILDNSELSERISKAAFKTVQEKFSIDEQVRRLTKLIDDIS